ADSRWAAPQGRGLQNSRRLQGARDLRWRGYSKELALPGQWQLPRNRRERWPTSQRLVPAPLRASEIAPRRNADEKRPGDRRQRQQRPFLRSASSLPADARRDAPAGSLHQPCHIPAFLAGDIEAGLRRRNAAPRRADGGRGRREVAPQARFTDKPSW